MKQAGQICAEVLRGVLDEVKAGVSCAFLDQLAEKVYSGQEDPYSAGEKILENLNL